MVARLLLCFRYILRSLTSEGVKDDCEEHEVLEAGSRGFLYLGDVLRTI